MGVSGTAVGRRSAWGVAFRQYRVGPGLEPDTHRINLVRCSMRLCMILSVDWRLGGLANPCAFNVTLASLRSAPSFLQRRTMRTLDTL